LWLLMSQPLVALARLVALEIARDERVDVRAATRFAAKRAKTLLAGPTILFGFLAIVFGALSLWAWFGSAVPWVGPIIAALLAPVAVFGGFMIVMTLIGFVFGFPLSVSALAMEGTDSFDALSRG